MCHPPVEPVAKVNRRLSPHFSLWVFRESWICWDNRFRECNVRRPNLEAAYGLSIRKEGCSAPDWKAVATIILVWVSRKWSLNRRKTRILHPSRQHLFLERVRVRFKARRLRPRGKSPDSWREMVISVISAPIRKSTLRRCQGRERPNPGPKGVPYP